MKIASVLQFVFLALFSIVLGRLFRQLSSPAPPPSTLLIKHQQPRVKCDCPSPTSVPLEVPSEAPGAPDYIDPSEEIARSLEDFEVPSPSAPSLLLEPLGTTSPFCSMIPPTPHLVQHGPFYVSYNHVPSLLRPSSCNSTITYTTHTGPKFLHNLIQLLPRWQGPVSVAVFVPGTDFEEALTAIKYLRDCSTAADLIRDLVSFHLFFPRDHIPDDFSSFSSWTEYDSAASALYQCTSFPPDYMTLNDGATFSSYRETAELEYPINVARNIAKKAALTDLVFPVDNELFPSQDMIPAFMRFAEQRPELMEPDRKNVFVVAVYELQASVGLEEMPKNKKELQKLRFEHKAQYFHIKYCEKCHVFPGHEKWIKANVSDSSELNVFETIKRKNPAWEPFYIGRKSMPFWDERLAWRQMNKIAQASVMCLEDYNFHVLDNAFLVHRPGVKKYDRKNNPEKPETKKLLWNTIRPEMFQIFGERDKCYPKS